MAKSDRSSVFVSDNMGISDGDSGIVNEKIEEQDREPLTRQDTILDLDLSPTIHFLSIANLIDNLLRSTEQSRPIKINLKDQFL